MTALDTPCFEDFLDEVPVDGRAVMREAILFARVERKLEVKVFGRRNSSLYEIAKDGMTRAMERETSRRRNIAGVAYRAALDPVTREILALELQLTLLRNKRLGSNGYRREYLDGKINAYTARLAELRPEAAE